MKISICYRLFIFSIFLFINGCNYETTRTALVLPKSEHVSTWEKILNESQEVKLITMNTGQVRVPISGMLNMDDPKTYNLKDEEINVEVFSHLIQHPTQGNFLIDAGLNSSFQQGDQGDLKGWIASYFVKDSFQEPGQNIGAQITKLGVKLDGVFFTHLHSDHTPGLTELPKGLDLYVGQEEYKIDFPLLAYNEHFEGIKKLIELDFTNAPTIEPLGKVINIFGDGSFWAIATPGHSNGHVSYLVNSSEGWKLLAGDASHTRWGLENNVEPGWVDDREQAKKSLQKLIKFNRLYPQVTILPGHQY